MKKFITIVFLLLIPILIFAQNLPKREFRGAWIATVSNIDWPSSKTLSTSQQQAELINILNQHQQAGINAIMLQIRTNGDALYASPIEPWAEWLTGKQGQAPSPYYDPLTFAITECHKRGIELHAWFNPYRAVSNVTTASLAANHVANKNPEWLLAFGNLRILDPGKAEARAYVTKVVMDVVRRYDIDGVHFDDYFYPYPSTGLSIDDDETFLKNGRGIKNKADWRRDNVNLLIQMVGDSIKNTKDYLKFGVSPFGIWQNKTPTQPEGSATNGTQSYSDIFADSPTWARQGYVDYLVPQLYWYIGYTIADYAILATWWGQNVSDRHLYIGQGAYRIGADANWNAAQMPTQIRQNRNNPKIKGSVYYNTNSLLKNPLGFRDSLKINLYSKPVLMPTMPWKDTSPPTTPQGLLATKSNNGVSLTWQKVATGSKPTDKIRGYVVYRFADNNNIDINKAEAIRYITPNDTTAYFDSDLGLANKLTYVITAIDRLHNESNASNPTSIETLRVVGTEKSQFQDQIGFLNAPNPFQGKTLISYQLSKNQRVSLIIVNEMGLTIQTLADENQNQGIHEYLWDGSLLKQGQYTAILALEGGIVFRKMLLTQ